MKRLLNIYVVASIFLLGFALFRYCLAGYSPLRMANVILGAICVGETFLIRVLLGDRSR